MTNLLHDRVKWDHDGAIARVTLARPEAGNALDLAMSRGLHEAATRIERGAADGSVRVALIAAEGSTFCVGGDLREFATASDRGAQIAQVAGILHETILLLGRAPVPIVTVVHATVAGGGIGLALSGDVVLIARQAKLRVAYTAAGLSPDCGSSWVLPGRIGLARALDLALTNRVLSGEEAAQWGLASRALDAEELAGEAEQIAAALATGSRSALAATKELMRAAHAESLDRQLDAEALTISRLLDRGDGGEGIDAFLEKRRPVFS